jgi:uncharacterized protein YjbJ (UPF0337 family)
MEMDELQPKLDELKGKILDELKGRILDELKGNIDALEGKLQAQIADLKSGLLEEFRKNSDGSLGDKTRSVAGVEEQPTENEDRPSFNWNPREAKAS